MRNDLNRTPRPQSKSGWLPMTSPYVGVTEIPGDPASREQLTRLCHRYVWAGGYCRGNDVVEAACGAGQGLGHLAGQAKSLRAGDFTEEMVRKAREHYGNLVPLLRFDAQSMPFQENSLDVIILFEALYYVPSAQAFVRECRRVLRPGGWVLIATANKNLYDFVPSQFSVEYFGPPELTHLFSSEGFATQCFGYLPFEAVSLRQRLLRPAKASASRLNLIPKTMAGKRFLKRIVFGRPVTMPAEIDPSIIEYEPPTAIPHDRPDTRYKVIYCAAKLSQSS